MKRSAAQNTTLHILIAELKIDKDAKANLVSTYTNGRSTSSADLEYDECKQLIEFLQAHSREKNDIRRRIISHFREMGYEKYVHQHGENMADMEKIEAELLKRWKKPFNNYTKAELSKIAAILKNKWLPWYYSNLNNPNRTEFEHEERKTDI